MRERPRGLDRLLQFDMPSSDVRVTRVYPILERVGVRSDWRPGFDEARAAYATAQRVGDIQVEDPDVVRTSMDQEPRWIHPREAFSLWAYGGVIHNEYSKERWGRLSVFAKPMVREMAHQYAWMLLEQGDYLGTLIKSGLGQDVDAIP